MFSNVVFISSLVLLTLVGGFYGFSFWCTNKYCKIFANTNADLQVSFLSPLFSLTYLYHISNSLHRLLNIIYVQSTFCHFSCPHQCYGILVPKILDLFPIIDDIYYGRIFDRIRQTQTLCIPLIYKWICKCKFITL